MIKFFKTFRIWKEKPGVICPGSCWCASYFGCYLHVRESFLGLLWELITQFRHERHIVGH